ncbi:MULTISPECIES: RNA polymerase sigma factor [Maribacter]|uniref:RNA polymerase sigma factor n=2 Tax=Maribacter TaxID=252356 RepID=A0A5R8M0H4_9FLAO|nr:MULTISPECIES: sigma-70 family RNA polymerase sigma factor [Maribacter]MDC6406674.1 sigma-70 family RNA polymerase sigma factor [Maribacter sp. PR66]MEE1973884.1 sigma-70 family RNA polymerase sigma factor [Maribacter flavus]TLF43126.1 sigma-70 family RNA polymerase sigma factor [Maribacter aurantiacus]
MNKPSDQLLIERAQKRDISAYEKLVDRYKHMVFTLALRLVGNREDAEEVAQDTFIKVYSALTTFKGESKFSTWLYKIAYRKGLDCLKKHKSQPQTKGFDMQDTSALYLSPEIWNKIEIKERRKTIKRAIEELDNEDSVLITLFYYQELSLVEISEIIGIEANTVKVKIHRARKKLALILRNSLEPETIHSYERTRR